MTASTGGGSATAFKSPLLQGLMAKQQASGETTPEKKFSSPLLNNLMAKKNAGADKSDDSSSNSSNSQQNSQQASPEHQNSTQTAETVEGEDSKLTVEVTQDSKTGEINPTIITVDDDNINATINSSSAIAGEHESNISTSNGLNLSQNGGDSKEISNGVAMNSLNGTTLPHSEKVAVLENGASGEQKVGVSAHQTNGSSDKSAGVPEERQGTFEEVLTLSGTEVSDMKSGSSASSNITSSPLIAFENPAAPPTTTTHTEEVH